MRLEWLAGSEASDEVAEAARALGDIETLDALDEPSTYEDGFYGQLAVAGVVAELMRNPEAGGHDALTSLIGVAAYEQRRALVMLLGKAFGVITPSPPVVIDFWQRHSQPDDSTTNHMLRVAADNGSPRALAFVEAHAGDSRHDAVYRGAWAFEAIAQHRDKPHGIDFGERFLESSIPAPISEAVALALFEPEQSQQYTLHDTLRFVDLATLPEPMAQRLRAVGRRCLAEGHPARRVVERGLAVLCAEPEDPA